MTYHRDIMTRAAKAIMGNDQIRDYCMDNFGRGLAINVGAYAQGIPDEDDSPFLWIQPKDENEATNQDSTFSVRFTVGGCVKGKDGEKVISDIVQEQTETQNGLTVNGGNATVERLRDLIMVTVRNAKAGARVVSMRREENDMAHFPLEWAEFFVNYIDDESLGDSELS